MINWLFFSHLYRAHPNITTATPELIVHFKKANKLHFILFLSSHTVAISDCSTCCYLLLRPYRPTLKWHQHLIMLCRKFLRRCECVVLMNKGIKELCTIFCQVEVALVAQSYMMINWNPARTLGEMQKIIFLKCTEITFFFLLFLLP